MVLGRYETCFVCWYTLKHANVFLVFNLHVTGSCDNTAENNEATIWYKTSHWSTANTNLPWAIFLSRFQYSARLMKLMKWWVLAMCPAHFFALRVNSWVDECPLLLWLEQMIMKMSPNEMSMVNFKMRMLTLIPPTATIVFLGFSIVCTINCWPFTLGHKHGCSWLAQQR